MEVLQSGAAEAGTQALDGARGHWLGGDQGVALWTIHVVKVLEDIHEPLRLVSDQDSLTLKLAGLGEKSIHVCLTNVSYVDPVLVLANNDRDLSRTGGEHQLGGTRLKLVNHRSNNKGRMQ